MWSCLFVCISPHCDILTLFLNLPLYFFVFHITSHYISWHYITRHWVDDAWRNVPEQRLLPKLAPRVESKGNESKQSDWSVCCALRSSHVWSMWCSHFSSCYHVIWLVDVLRIHSLFDFHHWLVFHACMHTYIFVEWRAWVWWSKWWMEGNSASNQVSCDHHCVIIVIYR